MALNKVIKTNTGYDAVYWSVSSFSLNKDRDNVNFQLKGYKDSDAYANGSDSIGDDIVGEFILDKNDPGISPYDNLAISYNSTSPDVKVFKISLLNTVNGSTDDTVNIKALIDQIVKGCYISAKKLVKFKDSKNA